VVRQAIAELLINVRRPEEQSQDLDKPSPSDQSNNQVTFGERCSKMTPAEVRTEPSTITWQNNLSKSWVLGDCSYPMAMRCGFPFEKLYVGCDNPLWSERVSHECGPEPRLDLGFRDRVSHVPNFWTIATRMHHGPGRTVLVVGVPSKPTTREWVTGGMNFQR
jgi:hypothetical protein